MPYSDPKRAEEYWAYCMTNDAKCQRLPECLKAARCLSGGPYPVPYPSCQAYDYCPKREACLAASRCLDARAGPPRRLSLRTTDIAKEYTNPSSLTHKPLTEVPEDRRPLATEARVIVQDDNAKIRVSFHEIELDALRAIRLGLDLIQAGLRHLERAKRPD